MTADIIEIIIVLIFLLFLTIQSIRTTKKEEKSIKRHMELIDKIIEDYIEDEKFRNEHCKHCEHVKNRND